MASIDIRYMRDYISWLYPSVSWRQRVNNMPPNQVVAIYMNAIEKKDKVGRKSNPAVPKAVQLSLFDK